jgi:hypothetical protein
MIFNIAIGLVAYVLLAALLNFILPGKVPTNDDDLQDLIDASMGIS